MSLGTLIFGGYKLTIEEIYLDNGLIRFLSRAHDLTGEVYDNSECFIYAPDGSLVLHHVPQGPPGLIRSFVNGTLTVNFPLSLLHTEPLEIGT